MKNKKFFLSVLFLVAIGVFLIFTIDSKPNINNTVLNVEDAGAVSISFEDTDVLPLYPGFKWNYQEFTEIDFAGQKFEGYKSESYEMVIEKGEDMNISSSFIEFYENILIKIGYVHDDNLGAGGVYSEFIGYVREDNYVLIDYKGNQIIHKDEVGGGPCPCILKASVFTGKKISN